MGDGASGRELRVSCWICEESGTQSCQQCLDVEAILATCRPSKLSLFVDGSFATMSGRERPRVHRQRYAILRDRIAHDHPDWDTSRVEDALTEALTGAAPDDGPGHGGAGLVLATTAGEILTSRSCAFGAANSSDAELQAVIRGARWAPGIVIYTDSEPTCAAAASSTAAAVLFLHEIEPKPVRFLHEHDRGAAHALAHQLSVEGRQRQAAR